MAGLCGSVIEYKLILAALIDSEQMLNIAAQLCTHREYKMFDYEGLRQLH